MWVSQSLLFSRSNCHVSTTSMPHQIKTKSNLPRRHHVSQNCRQNRRGASSTLVLSVEGPVVSGVELRTSDATETLVTTRLQALSLVKDNIEWHKIRALSIIIHKTFAWKKNLRFKFCMAKSPVLQRCIFLKHFCICIDHSIGQLPDFTWGKTILFKSNCTGQSAKIIQLQATRLPPFPDNFSFSLCEKKITMKTCMLIRGWKDEQILSKLHNSLKSYRRKFSTRKVSHRSDRYVYHSCSFGWFQLWLIRSNSRTSWLDSVHAHTMHVKSWYISEQKWPNLSWHFIHLYATKMLNPFES